MSLFQQGGMGHVFIPVLQEQWSRELGLPCETLSKTNKQNNNTPKTTSPATKQNLNRFSWKMKTRQAEWRAGSAASVLDLYCLQTEMTSACLVAHRC